MICRFLIEGPKGAVLHTGDFRAEPWFLDSLRKHPYLEKYLAPLRSTSEPSVSGGSVGETLEAIYLDTACLLSTAAAPSKVRVYSHAYFIALLIMTHKDEATSSLVKLMEYFPPSTRFFINGWTWGYEDIYKAIARTFRTKVVLCISFTTLD